MGVKGLNWILTIIAWLIAMYCANFITKMKRQKLNHSYQFQIKVSLSIYDYSMPLIMKVLFCRYTVYKKEISFSSICHVVLHNRERLFPSVSHKNRVIFNPLTPRSYQHKISPNKILTLSSKQLMRLFKLIR